MLELSRICIPYTPLKRELKDCRIALVSTSGAYAEGMQPFSENDLSYRLIPADTDTKNIRFVPGHFDTSKGAVDPNVMFPLDRLRELVAAGEIGSLAENQVSMGLTTELRKLKEIGSWEIAAFVMKMRPAFVVLPGGCPLCHRTVVTIQRAIETQGISTVLITVAPNKSEPAGPPRALYPKPFEP